MLDEFVHQAICATPYHSQEALAADAEQWPGHYKSERQHQGCINRRTRPMITDNAYLTDRLLPALPVTLETRQYTQRHGGNFAITGQHLVGGPFR